MTLSLHFNFERFADCSLYYLSISMIWV